MLVALALNDVQGEDSFCSTFPAKYVHAAKDHSKLSSALETMGKQGIAVWYSDNYSQEELSDTMRRLIENCDESTRLIIVVYGLPNKDCEHFYSNKGTNTDASAYETFLNQLNYIIKNRKVLYVLEPDALGLIAEDGGCGEENGYEDNLELAIKELSKNDNAEIYLDVGFWTLYKSDSLSKIAKIVKKLSNAGGNVKGITLNTSNYRKTEEMSDLCDKFQKALGGSEDLRCVVDTSRNFNGAGSHDEWCNNKKGGIGKPPTSETGYKNIDYFLWIKPPGESDGTCDGKDRSKDALKGPEAGEFFKEHFTKLWDQGYFVKEQNAPKLGSVINVGVLLGVLGGVAALGIVLGVFVWMRKKKSNVK
jgi:cellulase/cellobiase CelA1